MRVIAGRFRNSPIATSMRCVRSSRTLSFDFRPTEGLIRKSFFNILRSRLNLIGNNENAATNYTFLDLCCGTGACGIEAVSHGFNAVYFVDNNQTSLKLTKYNLARIVGEDWERQYSHRVIFDDACTLKRLKTLADANCTKFDIIYIDLPFNNTQILIKDILQRIIINNLFKNYGIIAIQSAQSLQSSQLSQLDFLKFFEFFERKYGNVTLTLLTSV